MIIQVLHCPNCQGTDIVRHGKTRQGKQRYRCREKGCAGRTFLLEYAYAGRSPEVKQQIVNMAMNASGIRDTARVLHITDFSVVLFRPHFMLASEEHPMKVHKNQ
jgi:transposase-like protein